MVCEVLLAMCVGMGICESRAMADLIAAAPEQKSVVDFSSFTGAGFSVNSASGFTDGTLSYGGRG